MCLVTAILDSAAVENFLQKTMTRAKSGVGRNTGGDGLGFLSWSEDQSKS